MVEQTIFLRIAKNCTDDGSKSRKFGQKEVIINTYNDITDTFVRIIVNVKILSEKKCNFSMTEL